MGSGNRMNSKALRQAEKDLYRRLRQPIFERLNAVQTSVTSAMLMFEQVAGM